MGRWESLLLVFRGLHGPVFFHGSPFSPAGKRPTTCGPHRIDTVASRCLWMVQRASELRKRLFSNCQCRSAMVTVLSLATDVISLA